MRSPRRLPAKGGVRLLAMTIFSFVNILTAKADSHFLFVGNLHYYIYNWLVKLFEAGGIKRGYTIHDSRWIFIYP